MFGILIPFKNRCLCVSLILCGSLLIAQEDYVAKPPRDYATKPAKNAAFVELAGNGGLYSLNVDRIYYYKEKFKLSARLGFAINPHGIYLEQAYILEQNFILFKNSHHLELGIGATIQNQFNESCKTTGEYLWEKIIYSTLRCGYRYQKQDDGFFLKAGLTPVLMQQSNCGFNASYFQLWAGVGVGMSF